MKGKKKKKERNIYLGSGLSVDQLVNEKRVDWCAPAATSMSSPSGRTGGRTGPPKRQHNQRHRFIYLTNLLILLAVWISVPQIINLGLVIIFKWNHIFVNFRIDAIRVNSSCDPGLMNYSFFLIILFFFSKCWWSGCRASTQLRISGHWNTINASSACQLTCQLEDF